MWIRAPMSSMDMQDDGVAAAGEGVHQAVKGVIEAR